MHDFRASLERKGFEQIQVTPWWKWFDRVTARKPGQSVPSNHHTLRDVLRCPGCASINWQEETAHMKCQECGRAVQISESRIILL